MRIAHVTDCYLPRTGGIEQQVSALAYRQAALGHEVHVFTAVAGDRAGGVDRADGVVVHRPRSRTGGSLRIRYSAARSGSAAVLDGKFDLVHAHVSTVSPLAMTSAVRAARAGTPAAVTVHSLWKGLGPLYWPVEKAFRIGDLPIAWSAVSGVAADHVRPIVGAGHDVAVVPNAVAVDEWHVRPVPHAPNRVVLVTVGRLAARKRPRHLLRMLRDARRRLPENIELEVVIMGDGPQRRLLQLLLRRHGLGDWVRLTGHASHDEVRAVFARADAYIAPATLESFGIAALEARSAGLPILARERSGIADFITDGVDGLLASDDEHMTSLIVRLAEDPMLRARMSLHNRSHRPPVRWTDVLAACDELYAHASRLAGRERAVEAWA